MATRTTAEVSSRSHTIAVGGIRWNRSLAIAAPTCTEAMPATTSHTAEASLVPGRWCTGSWVVTCATLDTARRRPSRPRPG